MLSPVFSSVPSLVVSPSRSPRLDAAPPPTPPPLSQSPPSSVTSSVNRGAVHRTVALKATPWLGLGLASALLVQVNGPLVLALGLGVGAYGPLRKLSAEQWDQLGQRLTQAVLWAAGRATPSQRALLLGVGAAGSGYTLLGLGASAQTAWVGGAVAGQGLLLAWILAVVARPQRDAKADPRRSDAAEIDPAQFAQLPLPDQFEAGLRHLHHPDALQRLVAVRYLLRLVGQAAQPAPLYDPATQLSYRNYLVDCLHLLLAQETEPLVREAIRQGLQQLQAGADTRPQAAQSPAQLPEGPPALTLSPQVRPQAEAQVQPQARPQRRRAGVDYVEYAEP